MLVDHVENNLRHDSKSKIHLVKDTANIAIPDFVQDNEIEQTVMKMTGRTGFYREHD